MRPLHKRASSKSQALAESIIEKIPGLSKPTKRFIVQLLILFLSLRGRYTFTQLARYGRHSEKTYRLQFAKGFDFLTFNKKLFEIQGCGERILAFDPSFIPKSGKATPGMDYFWNGCRQEACRGLELGGLAVIDLDRHTAFHLEAVQSPDQQTLRAHGITLIDHYAALIIERGVVLRSLSRYLAVDAYFSKQKFVTAVVENGLHLIGKLRQDANLCYLYQGTPSKGKGRPKKFDGKVNWKQLKWDYFTCCYQDQDIRILQAIFWSVQFKRKIKVVYVQKCRQGKPTGQYELLFSTDLALSGEQLFRYYRARFQIEFLYRDAKQHTGLTHCQARDKKKLHFHWNASLSAVSLAKAAHGANSEKPFSMASIKALYFNELMVDLFFSNFEINPELMKNQKRLDKLLNFGVIRA